MVDAGRTVGGVACWRTPWGFGVGVGVLKPQFTSSPSDAPPAQAPMPHLTPRAMPSVATCDAAEAASHVPAPRNPCYVVFDGTILHPPRPLAVGVSVVGRSRHCDIQITDPWMSRRHLEIRYEPPSITILDLDSTNGTFVDGERIACRPITWEVINLGRCWLRIVPAPPAEPDL
jgi:hypothetical protein